MSEYQYYQFCTINRTLSKEEQKEVNTWSSIWTKKPLIKPSAAKYGNK